MTSIIKVNNIQNSSGTSAMTIDGSSNITFPQKIATSNLGSGSIIQVVETRLTSEFSTTSTSFTNVGLSLAITPNNSNNKILLSATFTLYIANAYLVCTINKNHSGISDTNLETTSSQGLCQLHAGGTQGDPSCMSILDSPATTNEVTYNIKMKVQSGTGYMCINSTPSIFQAMEVVV